MASLSYLQPHIDAIHAKAVALDVPSPVIDALQDLLHRKPPSPSSYLTLTPSSPGLNSPSPSQSSLRPIDLISSLSTHSPTKHNSLFSSREHQDAQELFQLLSECIKDECVGVDKEGVRDRGLGGFGGGMGGDGKRKEKDGNIGGGGGGGNVKSVFDGLTANRRSCMECGYTEAVMHFAFDNWQLAVPRMSVSIPPSLSTKTSSTQSFYVIPGKLSTRNLPSRLHPPRTPNRLHMPQMFPPSNTQTSLPRSRKIGRSGPR